MRISTVVSALAATVLVAACQPQGQAPAPAPGTPTTTTTTTTTPTPAPATPAPATPAPAPTPAPSSGQSAELYETVTGTQMMQILSEVGFDATLGKDNEGDPMIEGRIEGFKYTLFFYRCKKQEDPEPCMDLQFHSSFANDTKANYAAVNAYNRDNRFGQAFFQENGEIGLDMSATLQGGVSRQHIKEVIDWWKVTLTNFPKKMGGGN